MNREDLSFKCFKYVDLPIKIGDSTVKILYRSLMWPSLLSEAYRSSCDLVQ
jgi:hypothetical protein